jgi:hypothetical protein
MIAPIPITPDTHRTAMAMDRDFKEYSSVNCPGEDAKPKHLVETLNAMMAQDFAHFSCRDYLHNDDCSEYYEHPNDFACSSRRKITEDDRTKIVAWCYSVIDLCQLNRETVAIAMNIVDRFMSNPKRRPHGSNGVFVPHFSHREILYDRIKYQLLVVSALYIAIKMNERVIFSSEKLAAESRCLYSKESIESMELTIMDCLSWRVSAPTALQVGRVIIELMVAEVQEFNVSIMDGKGLESIQEEVAYETEIAVLDYSLAVQRPATIAFVAIRNAIEVDPKLKGYERVLLLKALKDILLRVESLTSNLRGRFPS